jgi:mannitol-1-phosphate/altronate dehydrogenase
VTSSPLAPARGSLIVAGACPGALTSLRSGVLQGRRGRVAVPTYDRSALTPSVIHIGVGGFARAHQMVYFDDIAQRRISNQWGVLGVGLHSRALQNALAPQDYLYLVVERDAEHERARIIGSLIGYRFAPEDPGATLAALSEPSARLVTLTITGNGYGIDPQTGEFDPDDAEVQADLRHPDRPSGALGFLVAALDRRRRAGLPPFTVLSCDNIQHNGRAARTAVVAFARLRDEVLARWITDNVAFPGSMVDRITPQTTPEVRAAIADVFGVDDRWPVVTEPFSQWVVEDTFCNGRPPLDQVGARFASDVRPYELMKTRLLNASHCALGYLGRLAGYTHVHEALADSVLRGYTARLMDEEVSPLLPPVHGVDLADYTRTLLQRLANPVLGDRLERLCDRGSTKMPNYLLPSLHEAVRRARPHALLTLAVAAWCRYLRGLDPAGNPTGVRDPRGAELQALAIAGGDLDPRPLLGERSIFGDLGRNPCFVDAVAAALGRLERDGVRPTIAAYTSQHVHPAPGEASGASA